MPLEETPGAEVNPKGHDGQRIRGSIERFGFVDQPVLDERTGRLVGGHGRLEQLLAMQAAGEDPPDGVVVDDQGRWCWPVTRGWASRSDAEAGALLVALNRLTELGGWDDLDDLAGILRTASDVDPALLEVAGYSVGELEALEELGRLHASDEDDDEVLRRTDQATWPRISVQVPPDVYDRWRAIPGQDDSNRLMAAIEAWEGQTGG